tara:strand:+ start:9525 stop:11504 length:1980 start_codon:yes stop_codon:yes gene_type:complete
MTEDEIAALRKQYGIVVVPKAEIDETSGLTLSEKARLSAQGALFNFSDEGAALFRSLLGEDYDEAVADERAKLETARGKEGSLKYEIGGAVLPALAAAPFTGGASIPLTAARLAALGGTQAFASGVGAREGGIVERVTEDPVALTAETAIGAVAGPAVSKGVKYGGKAIEAIAKPGGSFARFLTGKISRPVETEIRRIAEDSGVPFEEIVERIGKGEIFPDLSEQAAKDVAGLYASSGKGGQAIAEVVSRRADELPAQARATIQADLAPDAITGNITKWFGKKAADIERAEGAAYNKIFAEGVEPSNSLNLAVEELLQGQKFLRNKVNALMAANRKPPLFEVVEGQVKLLDNIDLETAEIVRRALKDKATSSFQTGDGSLGTAVSNLEGDLRKIIDGASPELAATRAAWAKVSQMKDLFEEGRKIFGKTAEDAEIFIDDILSSGDTEAVAALRAGAAASLKAKSTVGAKSTMFKNLADLDRKDRIILEKLYPGDAAEEAFNKIKLADQALKTQTRVTGGSPTAGRQEAISRQGSAGDIVADAADVAITGNITAPVLRFVRRAIGGKSNLSPAQLEQVSKIIISEDPDIIQKALIDPQVQQLLVSRINQAANLVQRAAGGAGAYEGGEITRESGASSSIDDIIRGISGETADKIKDSAQQ